MNSLLHKPMFWVKEEANSSSAVDLVFQYKQYVIPIEINLANVEGYSRYTSLWNGRTIGMQYACWPTIFWLRM